MRAVHLERICVFAGSNYGRRLEYRRAAEHLAAALVRRGIGIVYGGARVGLMGALADTALANGGEVIGVIPEALVSKEIAHAGVSELRVVRSMHERKAVMAELADGFIALPGGWGTLEELFETLTWAQLGLHAKPCGLLNVEGYFDALLDFVDRTVREGFLRGEYRSMLVVASGADEILARMEAFQPPRVEKWIDEASA